MSEGGEKLLGLVGHVTRKHCMTPERNREVREIFVLTERKPSDKTFF